jgi:hypothetical protein
VSTCREGSALDRLVAELREPAARLCGEHWVPDREWCAERLSELLSRAEPRAWIAEAADEMRVLTARCPLGSGRALLVCAREPDPPPAAGAFLVGLSVPFGPRRYMLMGRPAVVPAAATAHFGALVASLRAPRGEFWRVHGAVLLAAARELGGERRPSREETASAGATVARAA